MALKNKITVGKDPYVKRSEFIQSLNELENRINNKMDQKFEVIENDIKTLKNDVKK